jgi:hypothetical protein
VHAPANVLSLGSLSSIFEFDTAAATSVHRPPGFAGLAVVAAARSPEYNNLFLLLLHLTDLHCCYHLLQTIPNAFLAYPAVLSSIDFDFAISRQCNVLD